MKYRKEALAFLLGMIVGVVGYFYHPGTWVEWAEVLTAVGTWLLVIFAAYALEQVWIMKSEANRQENKDKGIAIAFQVNLFRKEIICLSQKVNEQLERIKEKIIFDLVAVESIEEFSMKWFLENRTRETLFQQLFWTAAESIEGKNYRLPVQDLLNAMEELAINISATGTISHPELVSIRRSYIYFVEIFAWPMIFTAPYSVDMYPAIRFLYKEWAWKIDRKPEEEVKKQISADVQAASERILTAMPVEEYKKLRDSVDSLVPKTSTTK